MAANTELIQIDLVEKSTWDSITGVAGKKTDINAIVAKKTELLALAGKSDELLALAEKSAELLALLDDDTTPDEQTGE